MAPVPCRQCGGHRNGTLSPRRRAPPTPLDTALRSVSTFYTLSYKLVKVDPAGSQREGALVQTSAAGGRPSPLRGEGLPIVTDIRWDGSSRLAVPANDIDDHVDRPGRVEQADLPVGPHLDDHQVG